MQKENGLTLIEVLAAIVLLSVIFMSIFGFFINSFQFNAINDENVQGMNIGREHEATINQLNYDEIVSGEPSNPNYLVQHKQQDGYDVKISVKKTPITGSFYRNLHLAHIEVFQNEKKVSETYTYIEGKVVSNP